MAGRWLLSQSFVTCREGGVLVGLATSLLVALNRSSQRLILDEVRHSHVYVATADFRATVRDEKIKSGRVTLMHSESTSLHARMYPSVFFFFPP